MVKFLRAIAGLALGTVIFAGLLFYLVVGNVSQRLENPQVYQVAISDTGAYSRIYDEVLVDAALREQTGRLLGNMEIATHEEAVQVLRDIMPPAYLREQTEDNIDRFTGYLLRQDEAELEGTAYRPRGRGNLPRRFPPGYGIRSIPACAGEPLVSWSRLIIPGVYPRVGAGTTVG